MTIPITIYGLIARFINLFIPVQSKHWVFGADYGNMYREGSKYLLEYMLDNHKDYHCTFITRNKSVRDDLKTKGIPCLMNLSLKGMIAIAKADVVFTCQAMSDVLFAYKKKNRCHYYLVHGQSFKVAFFALSEEQRYSYGIGKSPIQKFLRIINSGVKTEDSAFISATSDYLKPYLEKDFGFQIPVKVLGMPRNDALFQDERMKQEKWIEGTEGKFIITYMPTHRKYGQGELSPSPFINRQDYQEWMRENNVIMLVKQHPNMIPKLKDVKQTDVIRDITCYRLDPQVCLYHSDVLITDFSSVWMDYLLLKRPVLFYIYDDFEHDDAGCHYDIREDPPGHFCKTEDELFQLIKKTKEDYESMRPSEHIVSKYHKYVDGNSCERYFNAIVKG